MGNLFHDSEHGTGEVERRSQSWIYYQMVRRDRLLRMQWVDTRDFLCSPPPGWTNNYFLVRANHRGSWTPGYFDLTTKICKVAWGGEAHRKTRFHVLCTGGSFVPCTDTNMLLRAAPAGVSEDGEPLYFGRVKQNGHYIYGKVQRSHGVCYVPINGKEKAFKAYQIFVKSSAHPDAASLTAVADRSAEDIYPETDAKQLRAFLANPLQDNSARRQAMERAVLLNLVLKPSNACWRLVFHAEDVSNIAVSVDSAAEPPMYLARARHEGSITPGFAVPDRGTCHIVWGGREWIKDFYEVLCDYEGFFMPTHGNVIPPGALPAGETDDRETLYIGRVFHEGSVLVGKVQPSRSGCYVPIDSREVFFASYDIYISVGL